MAAAAAAGASASGASGGSGGSGGPGGSGGSGTGNADAGEDGSHRPPGAESALANCCCNAGSQRENRRPVRSAAAAESAVANYCHSTT
jgi:hypothetical protein